MNETKILFHGNWLKLMCVNQWEYAERINPQGAVVIVAETQDGHVLFVEQFRIPIQQRTIEMPAGLVGDLAAFADEDIITCARRELEEETGYTAKTIELIMTGPSSAGMSNEIMAFVHATDLTRVGEGGGDATEDIIVHHVPRTQCAAFLFQKMQEGYAVDPKMYAGIYFLDFNAQGKSHRNHNL